MASSWFWQYTLYVPSSSSRWSRNTGPLKHTQTYTNVRTALSSPKHIDKHDGHSSSPAMRNNKIIHQVDKYSCNRLNYKSFKPQLRELCHPCIYFSEHVFTHSALIQLPGLFMKIDNGVCKHSPMVTWPGHMTLLLYTLQEHLCKDEKNPSTAVFFNFVHNIKT